MALRLTGPRGRVYLIAAAVIVVMVALFLWAPDFLQAVEVRLYDLHFKLRGTQPQTAERIVIAAIDEKSLAALGRWPWPRSLMADLIRKLSADGASIIAVGQHGHVPERLGCGREHRDGRRGAAGYWRRIHAPLIVVTEGHQGRLEGRARRFGSRSGSVGTDLEHDGQDHAAAVLDGRGQLAIAIGLAGELVELALDRRPGGAPGQPQRPEPFR